MLAFDQATAVERVAAGRYSYVFGDEWTGLRGPHGGFLAAIMLRAMQAEVGQGGRAGGRDPAVAGSPGPPEGGSPPHSGIRSPRSLTIHFAAPPAAGHALIEVREEPSHIGVRDAAIRDEPFHDPLRLRRADSGCGSLFHGHSFTRGQWYIGVPAVPAVLRGSDAEFFCGSRPVWPLTAT